MMKSKEKNEFLFQCPYCESTELLKSTETSQYRSNGITIEVNHILCFDCGGIFVDKKAINKLSPKYFENKISRCKKILELPKNFSCEGYCEDCQIVGVLHIGRSKCDLDDAYDSEDNKKIYHAYKKLIDFIKSDD